MALVVDCRLGVPRVETKNMSQSHEEKNALRRQADRRSVKLIYSPFKYKYLQKEDDQ